MLLSDLRDLIAAGDIVEAKRRLDILDCRHPKHTAFVTEFFSLLHSGLYDEAVNRLDRMVSEGVTTARQFADAEEDRLRQINSHKMMRAAA